jgi:mRNA interferase HigB
MRVISVTRLKEFWVKHPKAEIPLAIWYQVVRHAAWKTTAEMLQTWPSADIVERLTVFNIDGNDYRLIARVEYQRQEVYIRTVLTHAEYSKGDWKRDTCFQRR